MPKGDNTGPHGDGPKTGRAAGRCVGNATAGYQNRSTNHCIKQVDEANVIGRGQANLCRESKNGRRSKRQNR